MKKLKILLIAFQFPPYSNVGSLRIGKFARYLENNGHDVRVLCADKILMPANMDVEIDLNHIYRTKWINVNFLPELFFGGRKQVISSGYKTKSSALKKLGYFYRLMFNFPDERIGWFPYALITGNQLLHKEKFDFIYASSPSPTSLLIANRLSKKWKIPWIAEYRDPWADTVHYDFPEWRRKIENNIEKKVLKSVSGIVTISKPLAEVFKRKFNKPTLISTNGYASEDVQDNIKYNKSIDDRLELVYTGTVHLDIVKLAPLFEGVSLLGKLGKQIKFTFYTRYIDGIINIATEYDVQNQIFHQPRIPYLESLRIQRNADILLFLIPHQYGIFSTKIYEYISALRPILAIGNPNTPAGDLINDREVGIVSEIPEDIAIHLKYWIMQKKSLGGISDLPIEKRKGLSREDQFNKIIGFLNYLLIRDNL